MEKRYSDEDRRIIGEIDRRIHSNKEFSELVNIIITATSSGNSDSFDG